LASLGTPANFNGFRVLVSLLHRRRSTEINQTLHDVSLSFGLVYYVYILRSSCPLMEFFQLHNSLCAQVLCSPILAALLHGTRAVAKVCDVRQLRAPPIFGRAAITLGIGPHSSFYSAPQCSHCKRCIATAIPSVCPSVRLSVTRLYCVTPTIHVARCSLHCQIAKCV